MEEFNLSEELERFFKFYKPDDDPLRIILIGHLLIEEIIVDYIKQFVKTQKPFEKLLKNRSFTFDHKLHIAHALSGEQYLEPIWKAIRKLMELRNKVSHNVEYSGYENKVKDVVKTIKNDFPYVFEKAKSQEFTDLLPRAIAFMYVNLEHIVRSKRRIEPPHILSELDE